MVALKDRSVVALSEFLRTVNKELVINSLHALHVIIFIMRNILN